MRCAELTVFFGSVSASSGPIWTIIDESGPLLISLGGIFGPLKGLIGNSVLNNPFKKVLSRGLGGLTLR